MTDITEELRVAARSIALAGINGWGNLCEEAADTIDTCAMRTSGWKQMLRK